jgi:hypothetical protein
MSVSDMTDTSAQLPTPMPPRRLWPLRRPIAPGAEKPVRIRQIRRGPIGSFLAPIGAAVGIAILGILAGSFGTTWWTSYQRDGLFSRILHSDGSIASVDAGSTLPDQVTIVVRGRDGALVRRLADGGEAERHVNAALDRLDAERARAKALAGTEIDQLFDAAFVDRNEAINAYADWFFAWRRPYVVLKEAVVSTATHLVETGEYEPLSTAVDRDLKTYFIQHYTDQVLKPAQRDPLIAAGFEDAARRAHERWRQAVVAEDLRLQLFLAEHTRDMDAPAADAPLTTVALDWDAQRFQAPTYLMEDKAYDGIVSLAAVGTGGTLGAFALGPVVDGALARAFAGLGERYAATVASRVAMAEAGAAAGSVVQPVGGTVVGAVAGGILGLGADYLLNEASESFNRDDFVAANEVAVDATVAAWKQALKASLDAGIDRWFDDTRSALVSG